MGPQQTTHHTHTHTDQHRNDGSYINSLLCWNPAEICDLLQQLNRSSNLLISEILNNIFRIYLPTIHHNDFPKIHYSVNLK